MDDRLRWILVWSCILFQDLRICIGRMSLECRRHLNDAQRIAQRHPTDDAPTLICRSWKSTRTQKAIHLKQTLNYKVINVLILKHKQSLLCARISIWDDFFLFYIFFWDLFVGVGISSVGCHWTIVWTSLRNIWHCNNILPMINQHHRVDLETIHDIKKNSSHTDIKAQTLKTHNFL